MQSSSGEEYLPIEIQTGMPDPVMVDRNFPDIDDSDSNFIDCNHILLLPKTSLLFSDGISFDEKKEPDFSWNTFVNILSV